MTFDDYYRHVSPQLLARVRQQWSARGLDLDGVWRAAVGELAGGRGLAVAPPGDSRPVDLLLIFDQGAIWLRCLAQGTGLALRVAEAGRRLMLTIDQLRALTALLTRLREEIAAVRMLALAGLTVPAMQVIRSVSEDVDMALVMLSRPKVARQFVECRTPADAGDFWKRHIAGGRAFRAVAEQLYRAGLDYSDDSTYARWRKEVQVLLGAAVHTSCLGRYAASPAPGLLSDAAQEGLHFAALRLQEMCAYSLILGRAMRKDLAEIATGAGPAERVAIRVVLEGGDVILDQMRWLIAVGEPEAAPVS